MEEVHGFKETLNTLSERKYRRGINYTLDRFKSLLTALGNPEKDLKNVIHIAGTNGKGSTLSYIKYGLLNAGFSVGSYTSPHLNCYTERIQYNQENIPKQEFITYLNKLFAFQEEYTEFECLTAAAFLYFKDKNPDYNLIETGLGGRLDATNVINPILSIITSIGLDHTQILGNSLEEITKEKCGIIKKSIPIITSQTQENKILEKIKEEADIKQAPLYLAKQEEPIPDHHLQGYYQRINLGIAKTALEYLFKDNKLQLENAYEGTKSAKHWGRFSQIHHPGGHIIIDSAHNPHGIKNLIESLKRKFPNYIPTFIIGISKDKDAEEMLELLRKESHEILFIEFSKELGLSYKEIKNKTKIKALPHNLALSLYPKRSLTVFTGSIYFLSTLKKELEEIEKKHSSQYQK